MRNILFSAAAVVFSIVFYGCVNSGPAPQNVVLQVPDGKAVIIKDIYEMPLIENKRLKETEIVKVFFPRADNIRMKCSMTFIKIPSGVSPPKYKQTSSQIIYAISGGGKLLIDGNMIILKKGIMVYIPPNAVMSLTNNVSKVLELIIVTSPPFESSQMTMIGDVSVKVKVAKDAENDMDDDDDDDDIQEVSEKYRTKSKNKNKRKLSIEEYRSKMDKLLLSDSDEKDAIADLLNETKQVAAEPQKKDTWELKMPDNSKVPLNELEREQREKLMPSHPQKIENVKLKRIQQLTPKEQKESVEGETVKPAEIKSKTSANDQDSLEKLLNDQKKLIPEKTLKVKKTSLKYIQELKPEEHKVFTKKKSKKLESEQQLLKRLLSDQKQDLKKRTLKAKKTSLKHIQELSPAEKAVPTKSDANTKL